jgi:hypothetical protein
MSYCKPIFKTFVISTIPVLISYNSISIYYMCRNYNYSKNLPEILKNGFTLLAINLLYSAIYLKYLINDK